MRRSRLRPFLLAPSTVLLAACTATPPSPATPSPAPTASVAPAAPGSAVTAPVPRPAVEPRAADVASEEAIVRALYETISGPAGPRDWDRLRSLFTPGARIVFAVTRQDGGVVFREGTVEQYVAANGPYLAQNGFWEREIHRRAERHGAIAQVFSTYESSDGPGTTPERGINSIQLVRHGGRWWIANLLTEQGQPWNPIDARYLP